jgi:hypothetical protein
MPTTIEPFVTDLLSAVAYHNYNKWKQSTLRKDLTRNFSLNGPELRPRIIKYLKEYLYAAERDIMTL